MALKTVHKGTRLSVPDFTGPVIRPCDELIAVLIEGAISKREDVSLKSTEQPKLLLLFFN
jgi:hypothetical protein